MSTKRKPPGRTKKSARLGIEELGKEKKTRSQRKNIHMTEELGSRVSKTAALAKLHGRELSQSDIVEAALELWFETVQDPEEYVKRLAA